MNDILQKLADPDSLKLIVPVLIGFIAALIGFLSAFTMSLISPFIAKRTESNKVRIAKSFSLLEQLGTELEQIEGNYLYFVAFWEENYPHNSNFDDDISNFDTRSSLFTSEHQLVRQLMKDRNDLYKKLNGAWIYLPEKCITRIKSYLDVGSFSHIADGLGLINELHSEFFKNLLSPQNRKKREKCFSRAKAALKRTQP